MLHSTLRSYLWFFPLLFIWLILSESLVEGARSLSFKRRYATEQQYQQALIKRYVSTTELAERAKTEGEVTLSALAIEKWAWTYMEPENFLGEETYFRRFGTYPVRREKRLMEEIHDDVYHKKGELISDLLERPDVSGNPLLVYDTLRFHYGFALEDITKPDRLLKWAQNPSYQRVSLRLHGSQSGAIMKSELQASFRAADGGWDSGASATGDADEWVQDAGELAQDAFEWARGTAWRKGNTSEMAEPSLSPHRPSPASKSPPDSNTPPEAAPAYPRAQQKGLAKKSVAPPPPPTSDPAAARTAAYTVGDADSPTSYVRPSKKEYDPDRSPFYSADELRDAGVPSFQYGAPKPAEAPSRLKRNTTFHHDRAPSPQRLRALREKSRRSREGLSRRTERARSADADYRPDQSPWREPVKATVAQDATVAVDPAPRHAAPLRGRPKTKISAAEAERRGKELAHKLAETGSPQKFDPHRLPWRVPEDSSATAAAPLQKKGAPRAMDDVADEGHFSDATAASDTGEPAHLTTPAPDPEKHQGTPEYIDGWGSGASEQGSDLEDAASYTSDRVEALLDPAEDQRRAAVLADAKKIAEEAKETARLVTTEATDIYTSSPEYKRGLAATKKEGLPPPPPMPATVATATRYSVAETQTTPARMLGPVAEELDKARKQVGGALHRVEEKQALMMDAATEHYEAAEQHLAELQQRSSLVLKQTEGRLAEMNDTVAEGVERYHALSQKHSEALVQMERMHAKLEQTKAQARKALEELQRAQSSKSLSQRQYRELEQSHSELIALVKQMQGGDARVRDSLTGVMEKLRSENASLLATQDNSLMREAEAVQVAKEYRLLAHAYAERLAVFEKRADKLMLELTISNGSKRGSKGGGATGRRKAGTALTNYHLLKQALPPLPKLGRDGVTYPSSAVKRSAAEFRSPKSMTPQTKAVVDDAYRGIDRFYEGVAQYEDATRAARVGEFSDVPSHRYDEAAADVSPRGYEVHTDRATRQYEFLPDGDAELTDLTDGGSSVDATVADVPSDRVPRRSVTAPAMAAQTERPHTLSGGATSGRSVAKGRVESPTAEELQDPEHIARLASIAATAAQAAGRIGGVGATVERGQTDVAQRARTILSKMRLYPPDEMLGDDGAKTLIRKMTRNRRPSDAAAATNVGATVATSAGSPSRGSSAAAVVSHSVEADAAVPAMVGTPPDSRHLAVLGTPPVAAKLKSRIRSRTVHAQDRVASSHRGRDGSSAHGTSAAAAVAGPPGKPPTHPTGVTGRVIVYDDNISQSPRYRKRFAEASRERRAALEAKKKKALKEGDPNRKAKGRSRRSRGASGAATDENSDPGEGRRGRGLQIIGLLSPDRIHAATTPSR